MAQAINKKCGEDGAFTEQDEKVNIFFNPKTFDRQCCIDVCIEYQSFPPQQDFSAYLAFSGIVLHNAQLYETSQLENRRNQVSVATVFWTFAYMDTDNCDDAHACPLTGAAGPGQPNL